MLRIATAPGSVNWEVLSAQPAAPHLVAQRVAVDAEGSRGLALVSLVLLENAPQKMCFDLAHRLIDADPAGDHFADKILEPPV